MSIDNLGAYIRNISFGFDDVRLCWHGGEPLLMGIDFYRAALDVQQKIKLINGTKFYNSIQTNGILLSDEWMSFFKENKFSVGVSFDAPPDVNASQRACSIGKLSDGYIFEISKLFKKYQLPFNVLCVVSKENVSRSREIFNFFDSIGVNSYSLLLMMKTSLEGCPDCPTNEELFDAYRTTFDMWLKGEHKFKAIDPIDTMVKSLLGTTMPGLCSFGNHCLIRMITITPDGNVVPCGSFVSNEYILGNIKNVPLLKILSDKQCRHFRQKREACITDNCRNCEFISICRGGCREVAYWHTGMYDSAYPYCEARKKTFGYIRERLNEELKKTRRS
jgi:uncharacterized protein